MPLRPADVLYVAATADGALLSRPQVVPERELSPKELTRHDGSDPDLPLLLAIRGTVFDITPGAPCRRHTAAGTACLPK